MSHPVQAPGGEVCGSCRRSGSYLHEERARQGKSSSAVNNIDAARSCLLLAVEMYDGAGEQVAGAAVPALEHVLIQLQDAEAVLWEMSQ